MAPKKKKGDKQKKARVHEDLEGLDLRVNELGEVESTIDIGKINRFLDKNVDDKKLIEKQEHEEKKKRKKRKDQDSSEDRDKDSE